MFNIYSGISLLFLISSDNKFFLNNFYSKKLFKKIFKNLAITQHFAYKHKAPFYF